MVVGACAALFHEAMRTGLSGDVFYQLSAGQWMLAHHAVIRQDVFSYTVNGRPWLAEEWGFEALLAWSVNHLGAVSYWLVSAGACVAALLAGVFRWRITGAGWLWTAASVVPGRRRPVNWRWRLALKTSAISSSPCCYFCSRWADAVTAGSSASPSLLLVWANIHGSFLLGLGVLALELVWSFMPPARGRLAVYAPLPRKVGRPDLGVQLPCHSCQPSWARADRLCREGHHLFPIGRPDRRVAEPKLSLLLCISGSLSPAGSAPVGLVVFFDHCLRP